MKSSQEFFVKYVRMYPLVATVVGVHRYDHTCGRPYSLDTWKRERALLREVRARSTGEDPVFEFMLRDQERMGRRDMRLVQLLIGSCFLEFADVISMDQPLSNGKDVETASRRVREARDSLFVDFQQRVEEAVSSERTRPSGTLVDRFLKRHEALLKDPPYAKRLSSEKYAHLSLLLKECFENPLRDTVKWMRSHVVPRCRQSVGLCSLEGGRELYKDCVRHYVTLERLDTDDVHAYGNSEVRRLQRLCDQACPLQDRSCRGRMLRGESALLAYKEAVRRASRSLSAEFGSLRPSIACKVVAMPPHEEKTQPVAYYMSSAPPRFCVNLSSPHVERGVEALAYHEAVPGHHFQIQIEEDSTRLPSYRKLCTHVGFEEGWAVYAESLPSCSSAQSERGRLESELMRACRLVVDTGLHARNWTRERALRYMVENAWGNNRSDMEKEVDRYICEPGQALAYGIGLAVFRRLRKQAGGDVVSLHHSLLVKGSVPLSLLCESKTCKRTLFHRKG